MERIDNNRIEAKRMIHYQLKYKRNAEYPQLKWKDQL